MRRPAVLAALVIGGCGGERPAKTVANQTATRHKEIQEITGHTQTRVSSLVRRANEHIHEALQELAAAEVPLPP